MSDLATLRAPGVGAQAAGALQGGEAVQTLRVLSYNIQTGIATSNFYHYLTHSWKHVLPYAARFDNLDTIARMLAGFDIVGLQEADAGSLRSGFVNQSEYLGHRAGFASWHNQTLRRIGRMAHHANGLLSKFPPDQVTEHKLPGMIPGRGALRARFGSGPDELVVIVLHLALGRRARLRQIDFVSELIAGSRHVIVMGDLNCRSRSREMKLLMRNTHLREPTHDLPTFPSWRPRRNIDHILVSESLRVSKVHVLDYPLSDHLPIAMELTLPEGVTVGG